MSEINMNDNFIKDRKRDFNDSYKFTKTPSNIELLRKVYNLSSTIKSMKDELDKLRSELRNKLNKCDCHKALDIELGIQATISKPGYNYSSKFDIDRFKKENPELYLKYLIKDKSYSEGGTLVVKSINKNHLEYYRSIKDIPTIDEMRSKLSKFYSSCLMTIDEYLYHIKSGGIIDYDGSGVYLRDDATEDKSLDFDYDRIKSYSSDNSIHYVLWFNK